MSPEALSPETAVWSAQSLTIAGRLIAPVDVPGLFREFVPVTQELLGVERVCWYRADATQELLLLQEEAHAKEVAPISLEDDVRELPLQPSHFLGRIALGQTPGGLYWLCGEEACEEQREGARHCYLAALRMQKELFGVLRIETAVGETLAPHALPVIEALLGMAHTALERIRFERFRDRFVLSVSHELRTPLTSIRAFAEMLNDGDAGKINARQRRYVDRISRGAERLQGIAENLLTLSRLSLGAVSIERNAIEVEPFIQDTALNFMPLAQEKDIELLVKVQADLPLIITDDSRLQQALSNLLDNAIKFSPPESKIILSARQEGKSIRLAVQDHGPGIAPAEQKKIFQEFYRIIPGYPKSHAPGTGLGLSIVTRLVDLLGARIELESTPGVGSTFTIVSEDWLP